VEIPKIGLGTWELLGEACTKIVHEALAIGYRHIDTAFAYENHREIGRALKGKEREKLFITTKFWLDQLKMFTVEEIVDQALQELQVDYLDLLLIHWPKREYPLEKILEQMHRVCESGKLRSVGASNFTEHHLQDAYDAGLSVPYNQVEMHPYLSQEPLIKFCLTHQTQVIAFRPFGKGKLLTEESLFEEIGKKIGKSPSQVILRWILQKNIPVIPKAGSVEHLRENFEVFDFELSAEDEKKIDQLNKNFRYCAVDWNEFDY
jgi:2,5-diketo-D-gluconate reductase B